MSLSVLAAALALGGCKNDKGESDPAEPAAEAPGAPADPKAAEDKAGEHDQAALASYEEIRASLAKDDIAATTATAATLEKSARSASGPASGDAKQRWSRLADAAKQLHEMPTKDEEAVRKAFGDVSEALVALLTVERKLASGLHLFECPMAQGYKKWVQPDPEISNPYMGTRMPTCGSESGW
jgi:Cu(I)/Ag(I) efflux system membrane fusion protein